MTRYIEEVQLVNFQDHANTIINLTNGINLIVGSSDAGKSAILRAINYVFHNSLKGDSFIRVGCNECTVRLKFSDGIEVSRVKGEDTNSYILKDIDGNYHTFSKVGSSVPDIVRSALGEPPLDDKKKPISYSDQMSSLFLVDLSPTDLPRTLSELTGIQNLQTAAEILQKNSRSYDRTIKDKTEKIDKLYDDLKKYDYVDGDLDKIKGIETKLKDVQSKHNSVKSARAFISTNNDLAKDANKTKDLLKKDNEIIKLKKSFENIDSDYSTLKSAKNILHHHANIVKEFKKKKTELDSLNIFISENNKNIFNNIKSKSDFIEVAKSYQKNDSDLKTKLSKTKTNIETEKNNIQQLKNDLQKLKKELQAAGNWCDACDRPLIDE